MTDNQFWALIHIGAAATIGLPFGIMNLVIGTYFAWKVSKDFEALAKEEGKL